MITVNTLINLINSCDAFTVSGSPLLSPWYDKICNDEVEIAWEEDGNTFTAIFTDDSLLGAELTPEGGLRTKEDNGEPCIINFYKLSEMPILPLVTSKEFVSLTNR